MLDYVEEIIIAQDLVTGCMKINPYQVFTPMPGALSLNPATDFWAEENTIWASPQTLEFNRGIRRGAGPLVVTTTENEVIDQREEQAEFLRPIAVAFKLKGFAVGENLTSLTFDGISVKPPGTQTADGNGEISGSFTIPSNITVGTKKVEAKGQGGSDASAAFTGGGVISTIVMRQTTTIERWRRIQSQPVNWGLNTNAGGNATHGGMDPLAQTFTPPEPRQVVGIDFHLCALGDLSNDILVHQVGVEVGIPNEEVVAEAFVPMAGAALGWKQARYSLPVLTLPDRASAFVVKTDDANHSISIASLGGFDVEKQSRVGAQPYTNGVLLSSSNAQTWTPHQNDDATCRVVAAKFTSLTKTVSLGSFNLVNASDLQVRAYVELPSADCSVVFEIVRPGGIVIRCLPFQVVQLTEFITETVQLRAVLTGTEKLSPILFAPVVFIAGKIRTSGTYICRAFKLGSAVRLTSYFKAFLPTGATVQMEYDKADDNWQPLPLAATEQLSFPGWAEQKREASGITAIEGRLKISFTGGPNARPLFGDLGAAVM
jgi:hypothetical protein